MAFIEANSALLTAAFSAIMGIHLETQPIRVAHVEKVSLFDHHKTTYSYGPISDTHATSGSNDQHTLHVKTLDDKMFQIEVKSSGNVEDIKLRIKELKGIDIDHQRLIFAGKQLENGQSIKQCNIQHNSILHLVAHLKEGSPVILDPATLDSLHDFDFTNIKDENKTFMRGGKKYVRPCGFKRFALNVNGRFESMEWIGSTNGTGEWPVSYHGTGTDSNGKTFAENGYCLLKGRSYSAGFPVYSTPDVKLAEKYAKKFTYNNENYIVLFQNRVNPETLIESAGSSNESESYWVSPSDKDVRPYGICIRKA